MATLSTRCECSRRKERGAEACPRCLEWDARRQPSGPRCNYEGVKDRAQNLAGVRRALNTYLKEKGLE